MKKITTIYIDHWGGPQDDQGAFAKRIKDRLKGGVNSSTVSIYSDISYEDEKQPAEWNFMEEDPWENTTLQAIKSADIVIPIVSGDYMAWVSPAISRTFNSIIKSGDKYLFPILYGHTDWSTIDWIVKSKLIQDDSVPITDYSADRVDLVINELVRTVNDIINKNSHINSEIIVGEDKSYFASFDTIESKSSLNEVFVSHSHEDSDFAELLQLQFEKYGIQSWLDSERLKIGQDWQVEIDEGIDKSLAVIVIMTPEARKSEYVTYEWAYAWGKGKKIFPIMLKQTPLHPRLESLQYLDFTNKNTRPYLVLIEAIKALIEKD